jgi:hypothetical protein
MNFRQYIILMMMSAIFGWITWLFIVFDTNPADAGLGMFFLFYASLITAATCTLSVLGFVVRARFLKQKEALSLQAAKSFRQAIFLSVFFGGLLFFQSKRILSWWLAVLFIAILTMAEFFIISLKPRHGK